MWKAVNYESQGRSHIKNNIPCQDKTVHREINGVEIIALADGAGSAALSHIGAETVINSISDFLGENFETIINENSAQKTKQSIMEHLLIALNKTSEEMSCNINDLASTLLVAAVKDNNYFLLHIGDGVIGYFDGSKIKVASIPENGEFINSTVFVTSKKALSSMKIFKGNASKMYGFILMSDGTAESFYNKKDKSLAPVIKKIIYRNVILNRETMLNMIKNSFDNIVISKTTDDCSIAILSKFDKTLCENDNMFFQELASTLGIGLIREKRKKILRANQILCALNSTKTIKQISRIIQLKEKHTKKHLYTLINSGLISKKGSFYFIG